jgi:hypothetical protein
MYNNSLIIDKEYKFLASDRKTIVRHNSTISICILSSRLPAFLLKFYREDGKGGL